MEPVLLLRRSGSSGGGPGRRRPGNRGNCGGDTGRCGPSAINGEPAAETGGGGRSDGGPGTGNGCAGNPPQRRRGNPGGSEPGSANGGGNDGGNNGKGNGGHGSGPGPGNGGPQLRQRKWRRRARRQWAPAIPGIPATATPDQAPHRPPNRIAYATRSVQSPNGACLTASPQRSGMLVIFVRHGLAEFAEAWPFWVETLGADMLDLSRRSFVGGAGSLLTSRLTLQAGVSTSALLLAPAPARAWVMAALAVAGIIAGLIAANNRSDGGAMALLTANYELLKVALTKLDQIQSSVTEILAQIQQLPGVIDSMLKQENTRRLQNELNAVVLGYVEKLNQKDPAQSFLDWRISETTRRDIANLLARLQKSRQELRTEGLTDPATALVLSPLVMVEHSLLNILQYRGAEIVATLNQIYVPWFNSVLDAQTPTSAASYTNGAASRLKDFMKKASESSLGKQFGMKPGQKLIACVGLNDFAPAHEVPTGKFNCTGMPASEAGDTWFARVSPDWFVPKSDGEPSTEARTKCEPIFRGVAARVGASDRMAQDAVLEESEFISDKNEHSGLLLFKLSMGSLRRNVAGRAGIPDDKLCKIVTADVQAPDSRLAVMTAGKDWVAGMGAYQQFKSLIDSINTERTRYAFGLSAMISAETAKQNIAQAIKNYG